MDFLKTLALYLSVTYAMGASSVAIPDAPATAEPAPAAVVETVAPPAGSDETPVPAAPASETPAPETDAATPAPQAAVGPTLAPEATITPNPAYRNLTQGARGERVVALQERLIELGYLTGEADGAYGNQTRRAVLRFQYYNGLQQDGIAGRATQTILFESDTVVPNPEDGETTSTPVPEATATPVPNKPTQSPAPLLGAAKTPATPEPTEEPEEVVMLVLEPIEDSQVLLGGGEPLALAEGGAVRAYRSEDGLLMLSLNELCSAVEGWSLTERASGGTVLRAGGKVLVITAVGDGWAASMDGKPLDSEDGDILGSGGQYAVSAVWLAGALGGEAEWDEENAAVTLTIP